jgi:hypothetical protein
MFRLLLLAILGGVLLCAFLGASQQPFPAETGGMSGNTPKQPQMDAPPAVSGVTASQLQIDSAVSHRAVRFALSNSAPHRPLSPVDVSLPDSIQASTILRI